jgi:hypothetical protein
VSIAFDEWVASLGGSVSSEGRQLLRRIFDEYGPVSPEQAARIGREDQVALARGAVRLVGHDISATTDQEAPPFEYQDDGAGVRLAYWGRSAATTLAALTQPKMTVEVADFMQDEVMEDVHGAWPECASHGVGLHPALASDRAAWICRAGNHVVAEIGRL